MEVVFEHVTKRYGTTLAVRDLNLTIHSGALHFILGPSGCGKTATLRMLAGLETVSNGKILFDGVDVTKCPAAERGIGMVFQNYALWPHMTVYKNIEYGLKVRKLSKDEIKRRVEETLEITQLTRFAERLPGQLSGGQQQRVALARALAIQPNVLLLDEPLSNLDAKLRLEMRDNISRIHRQTGITTVYVTHDQKEALSMGTEISVMHSGELIQSGTPRALYRQPHTPFIAGFIGETNIIPGTYDGVDAGVHYVTTNVGKLVSTQAIGTFKKGDSVFLSTRPEQILLSDAATQENVIDCELRHLSYLGGLEQLHLSAGSLKIKANLVNPDPRYDDLKDGARVKIQIPRTSALVLPPDLNLGAGT